MPFTSNQVVYLCFIKLKLGKQLSVTQINQLFLNQKKRFHDYFTYNLILSFILDSHQILLGR